MARGFRRTRHGLHARLTADEAALLRQVVFEVERLLDEMADDRVPTTDELEALVGLPADTPPRPDDPALARLFPDAYADDDAAGEFRRYTQSDLYAEKRARLATVRASVTDRGGDLVLDADTAQAWLGALTDVRLTLGSRIGIEDDNAEDLAVLPESDPRAGLVDVYDFLTFLQESLVRAVAGW